MNKNGKTGNLPYKSGKSTFYTDKKSSPPKPTNMIKKSRQSKVDTTTRRSSLRCTDGGDPVVIADVTSDVSEVHTVWKCQHCHSENPSYVEQCISCLKWRTGKHGCEENEVAVKYVEHDRCEDELDETDETWVCRRCTYKNPFSKERCDMCEAPRRVNMLLSLSLDSDVACVEQEILDNGGESMTSSDTKNDVQQKATSSSENAGNSSADSDLWICGYCSYNNNPSWAVICDVCQSVKQVYESSAKVPHQRVIADGETENSKMSWECAKCTSLNTNSVRDCACCGALRAAVSTDTVDGSVAAPVQQLWACARCTLMNNDLAHVCAACSAKRESVLPSIAEISGHSQRWSCPICTFINESDCIQCRACNNEKIRQNVNGSASQHQSHSKKVQPPGFGLQRQNSVFVEERRLKEENRAKDQLLQIVNFCMVVSL